jgi:hypothetical protein
MSGWFARVSSQVAQTWTNVYTRGLPVERRDARRAELASDLWEHAHDAPTHSATSQSTAILGRMLAGVPADIAWRIEERAGRTRHSPSFRHPIVITVLAVLAGMMALVGLPGPAAAIVTGLIALKPISLVRSFAWNADDVVRGEDASIALRANHRCTTLLIVLGVSLIMASISYLYAASLESWGNTEALMSLALGWSSLAVAVSAAVILAVDIARARKR